MMKKIFGLVLTLSLSFSFYSPQEAEAQWGAAAVAAGAVLIYNTIDDSCGEKKKADAEVFYVCKQGSCVSGKCISLRAGCHACTSDDTSDPVD